MKKIFIILLSLLLLPSLILRRKMAQVNMKKQEQERFWTLCFTKATSQKIKWYLIIRNAPNKNGLYQVF